MNPVPGFKTTTPYGRRGRYWSCSRNSAGEGIHTGVDIPAPIGTKVVAARAGTVRHVSLGKAFGTKQVLVVCSDGSGDFYAHMRKRVANGTKVKAGDKIGEIGVEGNTTGAHLHFERHKKAGSWSCGNCVDPMPSINWRPPPPPSPVTAGKVYLSKLKFGQTGSDSVRFLQHALNAHKVTSGVKLSVTGTYDDATDAEVRKCQSQHGFGSDAAKKSSVGPKQAEHLFKGTGSTVVNDLP